MTIYTPREKRLVYEPLYETYTSRIRIYDFLYGRYTAPYTTPNTAPYTAPYTPYTASDTVRVYINLYRSYMVSVFGFVYI